MLSIEKITQLAKENSTPLYIFDKDELADRISSIKRIVGDGVTICYAMKANPFLLDAAKKLNVKFEVCVRRANFQYVSVKILICQT